MFIKRMYEDMKEYLKIIILTFIVLILSLALQNKAFAAPCSNAKLPENLKQILVDRTPIPVSSSDIAESGQFKKMIISFNAKTGGTLETGAELNLTDFQDAIGYASVDFQINTKLNKVHIIKSYLDKNFSTASELIKVSNVNAFLVIKDTNGKIVGTHDFKLEEGRNEIPVCEFGKLKDVRSITVKIKSFDGNFFVNHVFD